MISTRIGVKPRRTDLAAPAQVRGSISVLRVSRMPGHPSQGRLFAGPMVMRCVLGEAGVTRRKREGDRATPAGQFALRGAYIRRDRMERVVCPLPTRVTRPTDGWCDDPDAGAYNRPVRLPFMPRHENLWRDDTVYDVVIVLDYNLHPRIRARGSAIFLHLTSGRGGATAGCIAISLADMRRLVPKLSRWTVMHIV
jgi:L,D-peptidoglycan transpeptidase YkuD (ErfK/YbiS/YcfS/YnhG family)